MFDEEAFDPFFQEGLITDVIRIVKSGKEASVYLCRAGESTGRELVAVKTYRPRQHRSFRNDAMYKDGRVITKRRTRVAMEKKTRFGRRVDEGWWINQEYERLRLLHPAGADVPRALATSDSAILMDYLGEEEGPAPQLHRVRLEEGRARAVFDRLMWNVELFLIHHVVHADLSPFNVLYWEDQATIIDLPQSVDARTNPNAPGLLTRDLSNLCRHFARYGITEDPEALSVDLWTRYTFAML